MSKKERKDLAREKCETNERKISFFRIFRVFRGLSTIHDSRFTIHDLRNCNRIIRREVSVFFVLFEATSSPRSGFQHKATRRKPVVCGNKKEIQPASRVTAITSTNTVDQIRSRGALTDRRIHPQMIAWCGVISGSQYIF